MGKSTRGQNCRLPEVYITRGLVNPNQLKEVCEDITRGLGSAAILFSAEDMRIPLFKLSALPSFGKCNSNSETLTLIDELSPKLATIEPELEVPIYPSDNDRPSLFVVDKTDIALRLKNSYSPPRPIVGQQYFMNAAERDRGVFELEVVNGYEGGQVDYMVHRAVQAIRQQFPDDSVDYYHRGYIKGRDRRMRALEIYDYLQLGIVSEEYYRDPFVDGIDMRYPEASILERGIDLRFPETLVFGAMQIQVRERRQTVTVDY